MASLRGSSFCALLLLLISVSCDCLQPSSQSLSRKSEKLFPADCGRRPYFESLGGRTKRLVNSNYSTFGEYPWHVALDVKKETVCSGLLINSEWVVTTATCVNKHGIFSITVRLGEYDKLSTNEPLKDVNATVSKKIVHPRFDIEKVFTEGYDIAVLKMRHPIQFQPHIQPICLPDKSDDLNITGQMAKVAGWGAIFGEDKSSSLLQELSLPLVDVKTCRDVFSDYYQPETSLKDTLCAGYTRGKMAMCTGDGGGGLQMQRKDGKWILIGLMSWTRSMCADRNSLAVFTRLSSYIPWIRRILMLDAIAQ